MICWGAYHPRYVFLVPVSLKKFFLFNLNFYLEFLGKLEISVFFHYFFLDQKNLVSQVTLTTKMKRKEANFCGIFQKYNCLKGNVFFLDPKMGLATPQVCVCVTKTEGLRSRVKR